MGSPNSLADAMAADAGVHARRAAVEAELWIKDTETGKAKRWSRDDDGRSEFEHYADRKARSAPEREQRLARLRAERDEALKRALKRRAA